MTVGGLAEQTSRRMLERQIRDLERAQRRAAGSVQNRDQCHYLMTATCPPSTSINVRGGFWGDFGYGFGDFTPASTFDLTDLNDTGRWPSFDNPYWYGFYWMSVATDGSRVYVGGGTAAAWWPTFETAAEAEAEAMADDCRQLHTFPPWDYGIPIGCVILRNNGTTSKGNQFMEIDPVNRGRSYIWRTHDSLAPRNVM